MTNHKPKYDDVAEWQSENPIRKYLDETGYSISSFSIKVGVSKVSVSAWTNGTNPKPANRAQIAKAMSLTPHEFERAWSAWELNRPGR